MNINDVGQAFPITRHRSDGGHEWTETVEGMTLRQYAAIHLKQPDSGDEWLDKMILAAKRDELAAAAMPVLKSEHLSPGKVTEMAYAQADAMLAAVKGGGK